MLVSGDNAHLDDGIGYRWHAHGEHFAMSIVQVDVLTTLHFQHFKSWTKSPRATKKPEGSRPVHSGRL